MNIHTATLAKLKTPIGSPDLREIHQLYTVQVPDMTLTSLEAELLRGSYLPASNAKTSLGLRKVHYAIDPVEVSKAERGCATVAFKVVESSFEPVTLGIQ